MLLSSKTRVEYKQAGDREYVLWKMGDDTIMRGEANTLWANPLVTAVRLIECTETVVAEKKR